jgi:branched-subunit amino acid transport protein
MTWVLIGVLAVGTLAFKMAGPLSLTATDLPPAATRVIALIAPALLTALVVSSTFVDEQRLALDARAAGLAAGILALWLRLPVLVALVAAVGVTALLRALG